MIKLTVFKKKKYSYLYRNFVLVLVFEILLLSLNEGKT